MSLSLTWIDQTAVELSSRQMGAEETSTHNRTFISDLELNLSAEKHLTVSKAILILQFLPRNSNRFRVESHLKKYTNLSNPNEMKLQFCAYYWEDKKGTCIFSIHKMLQKIVWQWIRSASYFHDIQNW